MVARNCQYFVYYFSCPSRAISLMGVCVCVCVSRVCKTNTEIIYDILACCFNYIHSTTPLTARGVAHLVVHGTSGSTRYETISPVRLESSGGVLSTVDMVVRRRDGPRRLRDSDDDALLRPQSDFNPLGMWGCALSVWQGFAVPRLSTVGRRAFAVHGPMVWNSLQDDLRAQQDYESFRQGLKTWLFSRC